MLSEKQINLAADYFSRLLRLRGKGLTNPQINKIRRHIVKHLEPDGELSDTVSITLDGTPCEFLTHCLKTAKIDVNPFPVEWHKLEFADNSVQLYRDDKYVKDITEKDLNEDLP